MLKKHSKTITILLSIAGLAATSVAYRGARVHDVAVNFEEEVRYLIESGDSIGTAPATEVVSVDYLDALFGDTPELSSRLKSVVMQGLSDKPQLNLGEIASMLVTYRRQDNGEVADVVAHIIGDFPLSKRKPSMQKDGYFHRQVDSDLWNAANLTIGLIGRDRLPLGEEQDVNTQEQIIGSIMDGEILPLVDYLEMPMEYTAVFPDPRRILPRQLRNHVQAMILKGGLGYFEGNTEIIVLTKSPASASYTASIFKDCQRAAEIALKTKWKGVIEQKDWGPYNDMWWALELVRNVENMTIESELNIVRVRMDYDRVMVNIVLKSVERLGRDLAEMQKRFGGKATEIGEAGQEMAKLTSYWSDAHRWGPDWPIGKEGPHIIRDGEPPENNGGFSRPPETQKSATL